MLNVKPSDLVLGVGKTGKHSLFAKQVNFHGFCATPSPAWNIPGAFTVVSSPDFLPIDVPGVGAPGLAVPVVAGSAVAGSAVAGPRIALSEAAPVPSDRIEVPLWYA
jgi:hypothetical protein